MSQNLIAGLGVVMEKFRLGNGVHLETIPVPILNTSRGEISVEIGSVSSSTTMNYDNLDPDELSQLHVCHQCVGESFLRSVILQEPIQHPCDFCSDEMDTITLEALSEHVERAIKTHYVRTSAEPDDYQSALMRDPDFDYDWEREGVEISYVIQEAAKVSEEVAEGIRRILSEKNDDWNEIQVGGWENPFAEEARYEEATVETHEIESLWEAFKQSLLREARFLNSDGTAILDSVFEDLTKLRSSSADTAVVTLKPSNPNRSLFRARQFNSVDEVLEALKKPTLKLGSPPHKFASAGRMNAKGISVFYGAFGEATAIAEVRPPVGGFVVTAKFDILRDLRLLDLRNLRDIRIIGSEFDPSFGVRLEKAKFLCHLSDKMSAPVLPEAEDFDYLVTQVITEYLSARHGLDGMVYPSPQSKGGDNEKANVVLCHSSSRVKAISLAPGANLESSSGWMTDDGYEIDFSIVETLPNKAGRKIGKNDLFSLVSGSENLWQLDTRLPSLDLDLKSIRVHEVTRVEVKTETYDVRFSSRAEK